jgi:hypothetical protein
MYKTHAIPKETYGAKFRRSWKPQLTRNRKPAPPAKPRGRPYSRDTDWQTIALIGAGVAAGAVLGAGIALLVAPQSGAHTRLALGRELRQRRPWRRSGRLEKLGEELRQIARRRNRRGRLREDCDR